MDLKQLLEQRAQLAKEIGDFRDTLYTGEGDKKTPRSMNAEERKKWDELNARYDETMQMIDTAKRADEVRRREEEDRQHEDEDLRRSFDRGQRRNGGRRRPGERAQRTAEQMEELRTQAFNGWAARQMGHDTTEEQEDAAEEVGLRLNARYLDIILPSSEDHRSIQTSFRNAHLSGAEERAMSATLGVTGGSTVPASFIRRLEVNMLAHGGVLQACETMRTDSGEELIWPTFDDTANMGSRIGENAPVGDDTDPTFGDVRWRAYKYKSGVIKVPYELFEDSAFNLASILPDALGERLGRKQNVDFTTGVGGSNPRGLMTASTAGKTAASQTAFGSDDVIDLVHSVDPAYRTGGRMMMHDLVTAYLRKLKDGNGVPLWQSGMAEMAPDRLYGYPITINLAMDSTVAAGKKVIVFGRLSQYKVRMVKNVRIYRLTERYRDNDQDGFMAFIRSDGNLLYTGTQPYKHLEMAA